MGFHVIMISEGEKMKKNLFAILKTIILFLLLFTFTDIVVGVFDIDISGLSNEEKYLVGFGTEISFLIILYLAYRKTLGKDFKEFFGDFFNNFEFSFKYYLIGFLVMITSNFTIVVFTKNGIAGNEESIRSLIEVAPLYMIFSVTLYAPFTEELIFRKGFRDVFKNNFVYVLVSGVTFGALHVITYIKTPMDYIYLIPYCSLGLAFAYTYCKSNNIFSTISMHFLHNTMAIVLYLVGSGL